jgi:hypothetical protein
VPAAWRPWVIVTLLLGGCATDGAGAIEHVDPHTGVTMRAMASPFVYARAVQELAGHDVDYLSVGAVEVNQMGTRRQYLAVVPWTRTVRRADGSRAVPRADRVALTLGGERRELTLATHDPRSLGVNEPPYRPAWGYIGESWYAVTPADLRVFAAGPPGSLELVEDGRTMTYVPMSRADAALQEFIRDIPGTATGEPARRR